MRCQTSSAICASLSVGCAKHNSARDIHGCQMCGKLVWCLIVAVCLIMGALCRIRGCCQNCIGASS